MTWEEKIDLITKETDPRDFHVPFTDASNILKNIETRFVVKENANYNLSNWSDRIRDKRKIRTFNALDVDLELNRLNPQENYWIVLSIDASSKNLVYDSKPYVIQKLLGFRSGNFYIIDKKYKWFASFEVNASEILVSRSGESRTPWD